MTTVAQIDEHDPSTKDALSAGDADFIVAKRLADVRSSTDVPAAIERVVELINAQTDPVDRAAVAEHARRAITVQVNVHMTLRAHAVTVALFRYDSEMAKLRQAEERLAKTQQEFGSRAAYQKAIDAARAGRTAALAADPDKGTPRAPRPEDVWQAMGTKRDRLAKIRKESPGSLEDVPGSIRGVGEQAAIKLAASEHAWVQAWKAALKTSTGEDGPIQEVRLRALNHLCDPKHRDGLGLPYREAARRVGMSHVVLRRLHQGR